MPRTHMAHRLRWVDRMLLGYLGVMGGLLLIVAPEAFLYQAYAASHFLLIGGIGALIYIHSTTGRLAWLRCAYPLLLLGPIYCEVGLYAYFIFDGATFDGLVRRWDHWLFFGTHPHQQLTAVLSGPFWQELMHAFYLSYYALLGGSYLWVLHRRPDRLPRFAFVFMGMYLSFMALFVVFPVVGPMGHRSVQFTSAGPFTQAVNLLYDAAASTGIWTGAFPSSHVGMSVGIAFLLRPHRWWSRLTLVVLVTGIALSTTYGWFHYGIDAVAGAGAGLVLLAGWNQLYDTLHATTLTPPAMPSRKSAVHKDLEISGG